MKAIIIRWSALCSLLLFSAVLLHHNGERERSWIFIFYLFGLTSFYFERFLLSLLVRLWLRRGNHVHAVGIIGGGELAQQVAGLLGRNQLGLKFVGIFDSDYADNQGRTSCIRDLLEPAQKDSVDTFIIAAPKMPLEQLQFLIQQLRQQPLSIYLMPSAIALALSGERWHGNPILPGVGLLALAEQPINEISFFVKNFLDRLIALLLLIALMPVLMACAVGIYFSDPGPILFRQKRIGYKGRDFMIFKFRTMYASQAPEIKLTERSDARIFGFGMLLRKTSLDELPQLFNVLKGEMSLVGLRPHMPLATASGHLYFEAVRNYATRQRVNPGITGWAQVNGWRGPTETIDQITSRVTYDNYYIENWSIYLDFIIMFRTIFVLFGKDVF